MLPRGRLLLPLGQLLLPPGGQLEARMKLWWPQLEAMVALLAAFAHTRNPRYLRSFRRVAEYAWSRVRRHTCAWGGHTCAYGGRVCVGGVIWGACGGHMWRCGCHTCAYGVIHVHLGSYVEV